jgi:hypothetical protein
MTGDGVRQNEALGAQCLKLAADHGRFAVHFQSQGIPISRGGEDEESKTPNGQVASADIFERRNIC